MRPDREATTFACAPVPELERLNFFYGQMLSAADFQSEQAYFREKLKLHNRCLHGWGVVCGLEVWPLPVDPGCTSATQDEKDCVCREIERIDAAIEAATSPEEREKLKAVREELRRRKEALCIDDEKKDPCAPDETVIGVAIQCGMALDCFGNEIILRERLEKNLWTLLTPTDRRRLKERGSGDLYLSLCFCEEQTHPSRPVVADGCGALSDCNFGRTRDSIRIEVTLDPPVADTRCDPCCEPCETPCVLLAKVRWDPCCADPAIEVENSVRRPLSKYNPTVITGISWQHGGVYDQDQAKEVLGTEKKGGRTDGLEITFSRPVYAQTLQQGVIQLLRYQGDRGLRGVISYMEGDFVALDEDGDGCVTRVKYRDETGETLNSGDQVLIMVRSDFILDKCCRPVDGNHVGGRVPMLDGYDPPWPELAPDDDGQPYKHPMDHGRQDDDYKRPRRPPRDADRPQPCLLPPGGAGVWRSGNGAPGGTFESWIRIK